MVGITCALGLTECFLSLVFGLGSPVLIAPDADQTSSGYGYAPAPSQSVRRLFVRTEINRFSMRSAEVMASKPAGTLRILLLGDSVTYGVQVDQEAIFASLLRRELSKRTGRAVEVLNASAGGWAPANEIAFLKKNGTFDADLVLTVLNTADLTQPFAAFVPGAGLPTEKPALALAEVWSRYIRPRLISPPASTGPGSPSELASGRRAVVGSLLASLDQGRLYATSRGAAFGIVYIPARSIEWDGPFYSAASEELFTWCAVSGVPLIDLTTVFDGERTDDVYLDRGPERIHLSARGHALVAERMLTELVARIIPTRAPGLTQSPPQP